MKVINFVFKSGYELSITCDEFDLQQDTRGNITKCEVKGVIDNKPLSIDMSEVVCIYQNKKGIGDPSEVWLR